MTAQERRAVKMDFWDVNVSIGRPTRAVHRPAATAGDLLGVMDECGIRHALVWHVAQRDASPVEGNALLSRQIRKHRRLLGCWTILPPQTREVIGKDFFRGMKRSRIVALRAFPDVHRYLLNRVVFGAFLDEAADRGIPLLLSVGKGIGYPAIYQVLSEYPNLTCVICDLGVWGCARYTWPLLEAYPRVCLETSLLSLGSLEIEESVRRFGAERFLFGTGFPEQYPEASVLPLLHAGISEADKRKIASGNFEALLKRIRL